MNHEYAKKFSSFCEDEEFERVKNEEGSVRQMILVKHYGDHGNAYQVGDEDLESWMPLEKLVIMQSIPYVVHLMEDTAQCGIEKDRDSVWIQLH